MNNMADRPHFEGAQLIIGAQDKPESYDARFLISTLLVYVAKGDGSISNLESNKMIELLSSKMDIRSAEALDHLSSAILALSNDEDIGKTLQEISHGLSAAEKGEVFAMMLEVMGVDEDLDPGELRAIALAGQILGLSKDTIHSELRSIPSPRNN
jgi:uncharacterized tellurite resistance protein B-like protein